MMDIQTALEKELGRTVEVYPKTYIGDGVYAFYSGFDVILATMRGPQVHWLALELEHFRLLDEFIKHSKQLPKP